MDGREPGAQARPDRDSVAWRRHYGLAASVFGHGDEARAVADGLYGGPDAETYVASGPTPELVWASASAVLVSLAAAYALWQQQQRPDVSVLDLLKDLSGLHPDRSPLTQLLLEVLRAVPRRWARVAAAAVELLFRGVDGVIGGLDPLELGLSFVRAIQEVVARTLG